MVNGIVCQTIMITCDHHNRTLQTGHLFGSKIQTWLLHPVMIKQVTSQKKQMYIQLNGYIDDTHEA
jgi:hypothetical protein